ncbi:hypothetical protein VTN00DRAFT_5457 [Thermoascus crustaceus]|uniref:uncharacterized protein n=1 Tax=Thermoascus crustaceus TaxID=5088 RepID=UPI0037447002
MGTIHVDLALSTVSWIAISYLIGLYSSLLLYRLFSHPLNKFSGMPLSKSMGDLAFGTSFKMLETSIEHYAIKLLNAGMDNHGLMLPMWFMRLMMAVPRLTRDWWRAIAYCNERMDERIKSKNVGIPDIVSSLLAPLPGKRSHGHDLLFLQGDAQLIVIAGSPDNIAKLRNELAPYMTDPSGEVLNHQIAHINAVIYETLRLHPSVPTALQRKTPPEGIYIEETYIPGDMTVWCPQYIIGRSPYGCIGRTLALLNLRTTVAQIIMNFDFKFGPGEDGRAFEGQTKDHFTVGLGPLNMSFTKRLEGT